METFPSPIFIPIGLKYSAQEPVVVQGCDIVKMIKSRILRWTGHIAKIGDAKMLTGKPKGIRPLGRPRGRREGSVRIYIKVIGVNTRI